MDIKARRPGLRCFSFFLAMVGKSGVEIVFEWSRGGI